MDFNKIEKTIHAKNFSLKYFIPEVIGMTPRGFKISCDRQTLKVADLEKISKALRVPLSYWWDDDADLISQEPDETYQALKEENNRLKRQIDVNLDYISRLQNKTKVKK